MLTATADSEPLDQQRAVEPRRDLGVVDRIVRRVNRPVSAESTSLFRIGFGLLIVFSTLRFLGRGFVQTLYLAPEHHLAYSAFEWVRPLPAPLMYALVAGLCISGLAIAVGYRLKMSISVFLVGFVYTELIEASLYLNHYWFLTVCAALMLLLPVGNAWSLDARARRAIPCSTVPIGVLWALRAQLGVVYVFAGLGKLNSDWLIHGEPLALWFSARSETAVIGPLLSQPWFPIVGSIAAAFFDLTIVCWLLWKRSRPIAYVVLVIFHVATGLLFPIGVFPLVMVTSTLIFFEPNWPSRLRAQANALLSVGARNVQPSRNLQRSNDVSGKRMVRQKRVASQQLDLSKRTLGVLAAFALIQVVLPLRHFAYPSNVRFSEEGYYLSWRVMLTDKAGYLEFEVTDPATGETWDVSPEIVLTDWQADYAATRPDLIVNTARLVADHYAEMGIHNVEVRAESWVSMNGNPKRRLISRSVDLASVSRSLAHHDWILG